MENLSAYELAQQRVEGRQRKRNRTVIWAILAAICILLTLAVGGCATPFAFFTVVFAVLSGIEWYYASKPWTPPVAQMNDEMEWLFGDNWQDAAGVHEFSLAYERIRKRRTARVQFFAHLAFFLIANFGIWGLILYNVRSFATPGPILVVVVPVVWLAVLLYHLTTAFPSRRYLIRREIKAGEAIRRELEAMQPAKLKNEDKLKRGVHYTISDDGELVEVDPEIAEGEKPKHLSMNDDDLNL
jgi:predicted nucleic acid-binding Zn ribbon protein